MRSRLPWRELALCLGIVLVYAVLFQVMARTHMVEKIMTMTFSWWEMLLVLGFLATRILTYLLVPAALAALGVRTLAQKFFSPGNPPRQKND